MPARRPASQVERAENFGQLLRKLRRRQKLTQRELASRLPMSSGNLSRYENGEQGPPADEIIVRIAEVLGVEAAELLRAAGRPVGDFEGRVLRELRELRGEVRAGFERIEEAIDSSRGGRRG